MLRSADKLMVPAVESTLGALQLTDADAALAKLAQRYAETIDAAAELTTYASTVLENLEPDDVTGRQHLAMLAAKVGRQAVLTDLGPKLLATLQALQATPAARSKVKVGGGGDAGPNRLQALREARQA